MNRLEFIRSNGNVPKTLAGKDHVSGIIYYGVADANLPSGFSPTDRIKPLSSLKAAEDAGISADGTSWHVRNLHYQLSEIYRINPGITLYVGIFAEPTGAYAFGEVAQMQAFANGDIRQLAVWAGPNALSASDLTTLQGTADLLQQQDVPLSILYAAKVETLAGLPSDLAGAGKKNVSVVIGQDAAGVAAQLYADADKPAGAAISGVGTVLGLVSKASVHESIGWVQKFPAGIAEPAFVTGDLYKKQDSALIESLDSDRYIFFRTYSGVGDSYVNDSHNMDAPTSDYAAIELVRTMDKAVRGIRTYLLPALGSPLKIDASSGKLAPETVKYLEVLASKQLEDMERAGELSGFSVSIDPDQNVLSTSMVEFVIRNVTKGVFRYGKVNIGYTLSV